MSVPSMSLGQTMTDLCSVGLPHNLREELRM